MSHTASGFHYESSYGEGFVSYKSLFRVYRRDVSDQAFSYMTGLLKSERGKGNIERIEELDEGLEYHQYQHFISNSPWDDQAVFKQVGRDVHELMQAEHQKTGHKTGLIIDESAHLKKGKKSVGVARQYAGIIGKVDNCQVGVYASLCTGERSCLIKERLFLSETWAEDESRCEKAGIPESFRVHKTKLVLALEMIDESLEQGIHFDWVGGDGLYGHSYKFAQELDQRELLFFLDIHKDLHLFTTQPQIQEVEKQPKAPGTSPRLKADQPTFRVDQLIKQLSDKDWEKTRIRKTCKGWLKAWIHTCEVWIWDGKEKEARKRTLIVRKSIPKKGEIQELKYTLSNTDIETTSTEELAWFQAQRYWVEQDFRNGKSELGLSDYQVRKWRGWHHHHAIVFMAMLFMLRERIQHEEDTPLMSIRDARIMVTTLIAQTILQEEPEMSRQLRLMQKRHQKRKKDKDRYYLDG